MRAFGASAVPAHGAADARSWFIMHPSIAVVVVLTFSVLVTVHVAGSAVLARQRPRWNGAVALVVPPFFPYYALRSRRAGWAIAWLTAAFAYAIAVSVAAWR
jgi:hypothetical protein